MKYHVTVEVRRLYSFEVEAASASKAMRIAERHAEAGELGESNGTFIQAINAERAADTETLIRCEDCCEDRGCCPGHPQGQPIHGLTEHDR